VLVVVKWLYADPIPAYIQFLINIVPDSEGKHSIEPGETFDAIPGKAFQDHFRVAMSTPGKPFQ
jgi:hypothetical protein